jgi:hypothetical protein
LTFADDKDRRRKPDQTPHAEPADASGSTPKKRRGTTPEVGNALRAAYQQAIDEDIPPEFLDLLGKLG